MKEKNSAIIYLMCRGELKSSYELKANRPLHDIFTAKQEFVAKFLETEAS